MNASWDFMQKVKVPKIVLKFTCTSISIKVISLPTANQHMHTLFLNFTPSRLFFESLLARPRFMHHQSFQICIKWNLKLGVTWWHHPFHLNKTSTYATSLEPLAYSRQQLATASLNTTYWHTVHTLYRKEALSLICSCASSEHVFFQLGKVSKKDKRTRFLLSCAHHCVHVRRHSTSAFKHAAQCNNNTQSTPRWTLNRKASLCSTIHQK